MRAYEKPYVPKARSNECQQEQPHVPYGGVRRQGNRVLNSSLEGRGMVSKAMCVSPCGPHSREPIIMRLPCVRRSNELTGVIEAGSRTDLRAARGISSRHPESIPSVVEESCDRYIAIRRQRNAGTSRLRRESRTRTNSNLLRKSLCDDQQLPGASQSVEKRTRRERSQYGGSPQNVNLDTSPEVDTVHHYTFESDNSVKSEPSASADSTADAICQQVSTPCDDSVDSTQRQLDRESNQEVGEPYLEEHYLDEERSSQPADLPDEQSVVAESVELDDNADASGDDANNKDAGNSEIDGVFSVRQQYVMRQFEAAIASEARNTNTVDSPRKKEERLDVSMAPVSGNVSDNGPMDVEPPRSVYVARRNAKGEVCEVTAKQLPSGLFVVQDPDGALTADRVEDSESADFAGGLDPFVLLGLLWPPAAWIRIFMRFLRGKAKLTDVLAFLPLGEVLGCVTDGFDVLLGDIASSEGSCDVFLSESEATAAQLGDPDLSGTSVPECECAWPDAEFHGDPTGGDEYNWFGGNAAGETQGAHMQGNTLAETFFPIAPNQGLTNPKWHFKEDIILVPDDSTDFQSDDDAGTKLFLPIFANDGTPLGDTGLPKHIPDSGGVGVQDKPLGAGGDKVPLSEYDLYHIYEPDASGDELDSGKGDYEIRMRQYLSRFDNYLD